MATKKQDIPAMSASDVANVLVKNGIALFRDRSGMALNQAQRNLEGRSHYVDDSTMKAFVSRIHTANVMDDGLTFGIVESLQKTANPDEGRVFRPVIFDVFGNVIYRPDLEESFDTQKQAMSEFWKQADEIDPVKTTLDGAKQKQEAMQKELDKFDELIEDLTH